MVLNSSVLKKIMFLLLIVPFTFSLLACRTTGGTANIQWAHGTVHGYHVEGIQNESTSGQTVWKKSIKMESWQRIESRHTFIRYKTLKDIKKFDGSIDFRPHSLGPKNIFSLKSTTDPVDSIKQKVDAICDKVVQILGMVGKRDKVIINLYPKKSFQEVRCRINGKNCRFRAMYIFEQNTIYINVGDMNEGILAHEIAHAVIDNYLSVRPPKSTSEILARYVDENLHH